MDMSIDQTRQDRSTRSVNGGASREPFLIVGNRLNALAGDGDGGTLQDGSISINDTGMGDQEVH